MSAAVILSLPPPPSTNNLFLTRGRRRVRTPRYRQTDGWRRFYQELAAAPIRDAATDLFHAHEYLFLGLTCDERERRYAEVEDVIREKPDARPR